MNRKIDTFEPIALAALLVVAPVTWTAAEEAGLEDCQAIEDSAARLACYDAIASRDPEPAPAPLPEPEPAPDPEPRMEAEAPVDAAVPADEAVPSDGQRELTDEIGRETVSGREAEELAVRARVTRCARSRSGKYVYYFENGQVWRQRSSANVRWDDCDFDVTISKDVFGYVMVPDGSKRKVRIERVE
jgi:hypothetical protein